MRNYYPVELDCHHVLWFTIPPQSNDETLWCIQCQDYVPILASTVESNGWTYHAEEDFRSKKRRHKNVFDGECTVEGCRYECANIYSFQALRLRMHQHYMRKHTKNGGLNIVYADRYPRGSKPPF